jgi:hypothetical protein
MQAGKKFLALSGSNVNTISGQTTKNFLLWLTKLECVVCATAELLVQTKPHNFNVELTSRASNYEPCRTSFSSRLYNLKINVHHD